MATLTPSGIYYTDIRKRLPSGERFRLRISLGTNNRARARQRESILRQLLAASEFDALERVRRGIDWNEFDTLFAPRGLGVNGLRPARGVTLNDAIDLTLLEVRNNARQSTYELYEQTANALRAQFANTRLSDINALDARAFLYRDNWSAATRMRHRNACIRIWREALRLDPDLDNPWLGIVIRNTRAREIRFLDIGSTFAALALLEPFTKECAWFACAFLGGLRVDEASHLRWCDIDFTRRELTIHAHDYWQPKGKFSTGTIAMPAALALALQRWHDATRNPYYIFGSRNPVGATQAKRLTCRAFKLAQLPYGRPDGFTHHHGRHSMISNALRSGVPLPTVAAQARASQAIILKHYSHVIPRDQEAVAAVFDNAINDAQEARRIRAI